MIDRYPGNGQIKMGLAHRVRSPVGEQPRLHHLVGPIAAVERVFPRVCTEKVNDCGSSSINFQVYDADAAQPS